VEDLPSDTLLFFIGSRYCETDLPSEEAWRLFRGTLPGWARVQAICDFAHRHVACGHEHSRATGPPPRPAPSAAAFAGITRT